MADAFPAPAGRETPLLTFLNRPGIADVIELCRASLDEMCDRNGRGFVITFFDGFDRPADGLAFMVLRACN
jgi:hypothetical protein